ncbi:glycerophosphodiester phosphodiesterase [Streptomyces calvus]|uniref:Glycerophosphodiester phosphodiesterase n=1 Tax=Streptomyces calvus TaxID=67282 RepID=A0A514JKX4_9ACTN|nr:glycerophosphodiester phosphodiesterase family protein [Streptomyces calvus]QDI67984.1 glycerophosphodiester phosphodiesterase [Streptomyces calvus]
MTSRPAVSAHQGGSERAAPATLDAYRDALRCGAEYAEFDVRRTADGVFVVHHDPRAGHSGPPLSTLTHAELNERAGYPVPAVEQVMELIAGRVLGHLDLKETGHERELIDLAVDLLGEDGFVATTLEDRSVAAITASHPRVRTALSLGRNGSDLGRGRLVATRIGELLPMRRVRACGARGVAVHWRLARATVLREAARNRLFSMVWTVNEDAALRGFLDDPRVDVLITDRPRRAVELRDGTDPRPRR